MVSRKNEFGCQAFEQKVIEELFKIKNALNGSIAEKIAFSTNLHQVIRQRDDATCISHARASESGGENFSINGAVKR